MKIIQIAIYAGEERVFRLTVTYVEALRDTALLDLASSKGPVRVLRWCLTMGQGP